MGSTQGVSPERSATYSPTAVELQAAETANGFGWLVEWDGGWLTRDRHWEAEAAAGGIAAALEDEVRVSANVPVGDDR